MRISDWSSDVCSSDLAGGSVPPAIAWDIFGRSGHPVRTTITEFGPLLLAQLLELNATQSGVLEVVFKFADENGLLLIDLKDLRSLLAHVAENAKEVSAAYGRVAPASVAAIQRGLLSLENQGADQLFGEPALEIADLMRTDPQGRGYVSILAADQLVQRPKLYASRSEEHTSELQSLMRISYAVFCLKK